MKNLLIKLQNKRKEETGFTLVELLVVIAILAILSSVSFVGYMGFTTRAKQSNAETELHQAKTVITTSLLDGKVRDTYTQNSDTKAFYYNATTEKLFVLDSSTTALTAGALTDAQLKNEFNDIETLKGTFAFTFETNADATVLTSLNKTTTTNYTSAFEVKSVEYTYEAGITATWTL